MPPAPQPAGPTAADRTAQEHRRNHRLGGLLRVLLWLGAALVLAGAIVVLLRHGQLPHATVPLARLGDGLAVLDGNALLTLGLLVFLASPPLGLAYVLYGYVQARDWRFAAAAAGVLAIVLGGMALAIP